MEYTSEKIPKSSFAQGLTLFEKNAERLLKKAKEALHRKAFLCAFILGFTAWEHFGSALLILENWDKDFIKRETWEKKFKRHRFKIFHAKDKTDIARLKELDFDGETIQIRRDEEYLKKVVKIRTHDSLYVNFDFENAVWKAPMESDDALDAWAEEVIIQASLSAGDLQIEKKKRGI